MSGEPQPLVVDSKRLQPEVTEKKEDFIPLEEPETSSRIILCIGCHVDSQVKLDHLSYLLTSVSEQVLAPELVLVGLTTDDEKQRLTAVKMLNEYKGIRFVTSVGKKSQFENFITLLPSLKFFRPYSDYVIFSRDDDIWHPYRNYLFKASVSNAKTSIGVVSTKFCYNLDIKDGKAKTWKEVISLTREKKALVGDMSIFECDHCVRLIFFTKFLENCQPNLLKEKYCYLAFAKYLRKVGTNSVTECKLQHSLDPKEDSQIWMGWSRRWKPASPVKPASESFRKLAEVAMLPDYNDAKLEEILMPRIAVLEHDLYTEFEEECLKQVMMLNGFQIHERTPVFLSMLYHSRDKKLVSFFNTDDLVKKVKEEVPLRACQKCNSSDYEVKLCTRCKLWYCSASGCGTSKHKNKKCKKA
jgi:hypothetical protein